MSVLAAAHSFGVSEVTLRRYRKKYRDLQNTPSNEGRFNGTFSNTQLKELYEFVIAIDRRTFGLTEV